MNDNATTKTMRLSCQLNDSEVRERASEGAELMQEIDVAEELEAERRRAFKDTTEAKKRKLRDLLRAVRERAELRPVEVEEIPSLHRSTVEVMRRDTGEVVYSRPMTDVELRTAAQAQLWTDPAPTVPVTTAEAGRKDNLPESSVSRKKKTAETAAV